MNGWEGRKHHEINFWLWSMETGYPTEVGALFTTVSSIRVSRVSVMVNVRDSVK